MSARPPSRAHPRRLRVVSQFTSTPSYVPARHPTIPPAPHVFGAAPLPGRPPPPPPGPHERMQLWMRGTLRQSEPYFRSYPRESAAFINLLVRRLPDAEKVAYYTKICKQCPEISSLENEIRNAFRIGTRRSRTGRGPRKTRRRRKKKAQGRK